MSRPGMRCASTKSLLITYYTYLTDIYIANKKKFVNTQNSSASRHTFHYQGEIIKHKSHKARVVSGI
jgi:hypothetical protein